MTFPKLTTDGCILFGTRAVRMFAYGFLSVVLIVGPKLFIEPGTKAFFPAFERERPRIVNNFAASASSGYELSSFSEKMNSTRLSNLAVVLEPGNEYSDEDESSLRRLRLAIRNSHPSRAARTTRYRLPTFHGKARI